MSSSSRSLLYRWKFKKKRTSLIFVLPVLSYPLSPRTCQLRISPFFALPLVIIRFFDTIFFFFFSFFSINVCRVYDLLNFDMKCHRWFDFLYFKSQISFYSVEFDNFVLSFWNGGFYVWIFFFFWEIEESLNWWRIKYVSSLRSVIDWDSSRLISYR